MSSDSSISRKLTATSEHSSERQTIPPDNRSSDNRFPDCSQNWTEEDDLINEQIEKTKSEIIRIDFFGTLTALATITLFLALTGAVFDHWIFRYGLTVQARVILAVVFALILFAVFVYRLYPLFRYKLNSLYAADILEKNVGATGNPIINWLLLKKSENASRSSGLEASVLRGVTQQALKQVEALPAESVVDHSLIVRWGIGFCFIFFISGLYFIFSPKSMTVSITRIIRPKAAIAAPRSIRFRKIEPGNCRVVQGTKILFRAEIGGVRGQDVWLSWSTSDGRLVNRTKAMPNEEGPFYAVDFTEDPKGVLESFRYKIVVGSPKDSENFSETYSVDVQPALSIAAEKLVLTYPEYTKLMPQILSQTGSIKAIEGTKVDLTVRANAPLKTAFLVPGENVEKQRELRISSDNPAVADISFLLTAQKDSSDFIFSTVKTYEIRGLGEFDNNNQVKCEYPISTIPDQAPTVDWERVPDGRFELPLNKKLEFSVRAEDPDFGLVSAKLFIAKRILQENEADNISAESPVSPVELLSEQNKNVPTAQVINGVIDPGKWKPVVGQEYEYWVEVADNKPVIPNMAKTNKKIFIISATKLNIPEEEKKPDEEKKKSDSEQKQDQKNEGAGGKEGNEGGGSGGDNSQSPQKESDNPNGTPQNQQGGSEGQNGSGQDGSGENQQESTQKSDSSGQNSPSQGNNQNGSGQSSSQQNSQNSDDQNGQSSGESSFQEKNEENMGQKSESSSNTQSNDANNQNKNNNSDNNFDDKSEEKNKGGGKNQNSGKTENNGTEENNSNDGQKGKNSTGTQTTENQNSSIDPETNPGDAFEKILDHQREKKGNETQPKQSKGEEKPKEQKSGENNESSNDPNKGESSNIPPNQENEQQKPSDRPLNSDEASTEEGKHPDGGKTDQIPENSSNRPVDPNAKRFTAENVTEIPKEAEREKGEVDPSTKNYKIDDNQKKKGPEQQVRADANIAKDPQNPSASGQSVPDDGKGRDIKADDPNELGPNFKMENGKSEKQKEDSKKRNNSEAPDLDLNKVPPLAGEGGDNNDGPTAHLPDFGDSNKLENGKAPSNGNKKGDAPQNPESGAGGSGYGEMQEGQEARAADDPNLKYTMQATDLALNYIEDQLKGDPDPELLDRLGWNKEQLRDFLVKWRQMQEKAKKSHPLSKERVDYLESLRNIGLRAPAKRTVLQSSHLSGNDPSEKESEVIRYTPPRPFKDRFKAYSQGISQSSNNK